MNWKVEVADITKQQVDAIVNAANEACLGGGGVDGAIHRAAGGALLAECLKLPEVRPSVRCPMGEARITGAGNLPCGHVIHTVGPDCRWIADPVEQDRLLASAYASSLQLARENGVKTMAFPSIATGIYGFPIERAAGIVAKTVGDFLAQAPDMSVTMCIYDRTPMVQERLLKAYKDAFAAYDAKAMLKTPAISRQLSVEQCEFLERVSRDLAFIAQRINRQLSEGRAPKPGTTAYAAFKAIDGHVLQSLATIDASGQAQRLMEVYEAVRHSESRGWSLMVLPGYWKPDLYDQKDPTASTGLSVWGFDRSKVTKRPAGQKAKATDGFPKELTPEMLKDFTWCGVGGTRPRDGWIDGVHYIAKCRKYARENRDGIPSDGHVHNECLADDFLRAAGLNVPESREYVVDFPAPDGKCVVRLARFIENTEGLAEAFDRAQDKSALVAQVLAAYPIQSFIAGIDTFQNDNVRVDAHGKLWFVDNGASFAYRALGGDKAWWRTRSDVDDANTGYLSLRNHPHSSLLQTILTMSDAELWAAGADFDFVALAEKLPKELLWDTVMAYAMTLNSRMKEIAGR